jgi:hypothetical protein
MRTSFDLLDESPHQALLATPGLLGLRLRTLLPPWSRLTRPSAIWHNHFAI